MNEWGELIELYDKYHGGWEMKIKKFNNSHDRFLIIDNSEVYHFGASLKDPGKKWFAFSKMDIGALDMLTKLEEIA